jgi:hypothetical protein
MAVMRRRSRPRRIPLKFALRNYVLGTCSTCGGRTETSPLSGLWWHLEPFDRPCTAAWRPEHFVEDAPEVAEGGKT